MNKKRIVLASTLAVLIAPSVLGSISNQTTTIKADTANAVTGDYIKNPIGTVDYGGAYAYDSNGNKLTLFLSGKSSWKLGKSVLINGQRFYGIGANEYVSPENITITDGMPPVLPTLVKEVYQGQIGTLGYAVKVVDMYGNPTGRVLPAGSSWKLGNLYVLKDGNTYYKISSNEYALATVITLSSNTSNNQNSNTNVGVLGYDAKVVDSNGTYIGVTLPAGSSWQLGQFVRIGNNGYYQVATNEYVLASIVNSSNYSFNATLKTNTSIYNSSTSSLTRTLPAGSSWKITTVLRNKNNEFWGKISTNEWIKIDDNLDVPYGASDSVPSVAINEPEFATNVSNNNSSNNNDVSLTTTLINGQSVYNTASNTMSRALPAGSSWKISQVVRNKNNQFWGKVSTNEWLLIDANNMNMSMGDSDKVPNVAVSEPEFATSVIK